MTVMSSDATPDFFSFSRSRTPHGQCDRYKRKTIAAKLDFEISRLALPTKFFPNSHR